jgi:hypothetical protein
MIAHPPRRVALAGWRGRLGPLASLAAGALLLASAAPAAAQVAIVTHHNDISRSGWNSAERVLTPANVAAPGPGGAFGLLATVPLDSPVDAQPLIVPDVMVSGDPNPGTHDVVYVATQNNTVYAIDPTRGTVLLTRNFGTPTGAPQGCNGSTKGVGITGTPVIDLKRKLLYVVAFTLDQLAGGGTMFNYRLHALDLGTLADTIPARVIAGGGTLTDGTTLSFPPGIERQRPSLLEHNSAIYTAFGSFCDFPAARGWLFGWSADSLAPIHPGPGGVATGDLTDRNATGTQFLSSIWMSGAAPAADATGIYYVTGNSTKGGGSYDPVNNPEHSVVRVSPSTVSVLDVFTPSNLVYLDTNDLDFSAGGVLLVPSTGTGQPPMAAAAGKFGTLYLLDRTDLGGYTPGGPDKVLDSVAIGPCWCTPSYFNDGTPTIVSSGGTSVILWQIQSSPTLLVKRAASPELPTGPDPGFFTSVSSSGAKHTIIWAVTRPVSADDPRVWLYAFQVNPTGQQLPQIFAGVAGTWGDANHDANTVPVVANGRVYVVNDAGLSIFGLGASAQ